MPAPRHRIAFRPSARRDFLALPRKIQRQVGKRIQALRADPTPAGVKRLHGSEGLLRIRSGDYRVVYLIEGGRLVVLVVRIGLRREVYRFPGAPSRPLPVRRAHRAPAGGVSVRLSAWVRIAETLSEEALADLEGIVGVPSADQNFRSMVTSLASAYVSQMEEPQRAQLLAHVARVRAQTLKLRGLLGGNGGALFGLHPIKVPSNDGSKSTSTSEAARLRMIKRHTSSWKKPGDRHWVDRAIEELGILLEEVARQRERLFVTNRPRDSAFEDLVFGLAATFRHATGKRPTKGRFARFVARLLGLIGPPYVRSESTVCRAVERLRP